MANEGITLDLKLITSQALKALDKVNENTSKLDNGLKNIEKRSFSKLSQSMITLNQGLQLATSLYRSFSRVIGSVIDAGIQQEEAINDLNVALRVSGNYSEEASLKFQKFASELQKVSKFGDETTLKAGALLHQMSKLTGEGLEKGVKAAADMASALNIDLNTAIKLIGKSAEDSGSGLKRYGIVVEAGTNASENLANAITAVNNQFGGTAEGKINTFSGALAQSKNAFGDLLEEIGLLIVQNPIVIEALQASTKIFISLAESAKTVGQNISSMITSVTTSIGTITGFNIAAKLSEEISQMKLQVETLKAELTENEGSIFDILWGGTESKRESTIERINELNILIMEKQAELKKTQVEKRKEEVKEVKEHNKVIQKEHYDFYESWKQHIKSFKRFEDMTNAERIQSQKDTVGNLAQLQNSGNAQMRTIGKAAALTQIGISTQEGAIKAYSSLAGIPIVGPALGAVAAGALIAYGAERAKNVLGFETGGIVPGSSYTGDKVPVNVNSAEMILNKSQQANLFEAISNNNLGNSNSDLISEIRALGNRIANLEIVVKCSDVEIGRSVNRAVADGLILQGI